MKKEVREFLMSLGKEVLKRRLGVKVDELRGLASVIGEMDTDFGHGTILRATVKYPETLAEYNQLKEQAQFCEIDTSEFDRKVEEAEKVKSTIRY